ncbi:MAG: diaminopimelate epimerase [Candidatus Sulfobium sp.]|jgi:diaminopimelate epimerase
MKLYFTKMHGIGNDFILIDCRRFVPDDLPGLARRLCRRRFGIGADQLILLHDSNRADFTMRIYNADGGEVEMCGNGIRCFAKYIWDRGLSEKECLDVETLAGTIRPERAGDMVRVDMGEPVLEPEKIPVKIPPGSGAGVQGDISRLAPHASRVVDYPLKIEDREFRITCVSMGNPHAVIVVDSVGDFDIGRYGPVIEHHKMFPKRVNAEFIEVRGRDSLRMRVWERGSGETMACGTGASAAVVAAVINGLTGRRVNVALLGGELVVEWKEDNHVYMTGEAVEVFEGWVDL